MNESPLTLLDAWADEDTNNGEWPFPTRYLESQAQGELAERIRRALGVVGDVPVFVTEQIVSGGWSEYTQEDDHSLTIRVGQSRHELGCDFWSGGLISLLRWLDNDAPVKDKP